MYEQIKDIIPRRYRYLARAAWCDTMSPLFSGNAVECPLCQKASSRWISVGLDKAMCPRCLARDRHRLLSLYMRNELQIETERLRILHFAAEYCFIRCFRRMPNLTHIIADLDPPRGGVKMDITDIPLRPESVDVVICSHVLEHVHNDTKAMRELRRVTRPGGTALIMGPVDYARDTTYEDSTIVDPDARRAAFNQSDHVRIYGSDFDDRLRIAGFNVNATPYALSVGDERSKRNGLNPNELLYVCT